MIGNLSSILMRAPLQSFKQAYDFSDEINGYFQEGLYLSSETLWKETQKQDSLSEKEKASCNSRFQNIIYVVAADVRLTAHLPAAR